MDARNLATVRKMWQREVEAAAIYRGLAERERDAKRKDILNRLALDLDKKRSLAFNTGEIIYLDSPSVVHGLHSLYETARLRH